MSLSFTERNSYRTQYLLLCQKGDKIKGEDCNRLVCGPLLWLLLLLLLPKPAIARWRAKVFHLLDFHKHLLVCSPIYLLAELVQLGFCFQFYNKSTNYLQDRNVILLPSCNDELIYYRAQNSFRGLFSKVFHKFMYNI